MKAIIFDWGRTLHDPDTDELFDGTEEVMKECVVNGYILGIVSLAKSQSPKERQKTIMESGISSLVKHILIGDENKSELYKEMLKLLGVSASETIIVDDRTLRGIAWGNQYGAKTVWIKRGKFATEVPNKNTGEPSAIITDIRELPGVFNILKK